MKNIKRFLGVAVLALMAFGLFTVANENGIENSNLDTREITYMDFGDTRPPEYVSK